MAEIILAESAWDDLDLITDYIAKDSVRYAQEFSDRIFERIEGLKDFPLMGRVVPEYQNVELRELVMGRYRIVYRIFSADEIVVLRIVHGAKLLD